MSQLKFPTIDNLIENQNHRNSRKIDYSHGFIKYNMNKNLLLDN